MNLHAIVSNGVNVVNPFVPLVVQVSLGYTTSADGSRAPSYAQPVPVMGQVQALEYRDILQLESLNIQGQQRAIYIRGEVDGLVRPSKKGGDLITTPDGRIWLVTLVLEYWPDWCKAAVTLQDGS
jgi:hypothetical protein